MDTVSPATLAMKPGQRPSASRTAGFVEVAVATGVTVASGAGPSPNFAVDPGTAAGGAADLSPADCPEQAVARASMQTARPVAASSLGRRDGMSRRSHTRATQ